MVQVFSAWHMGKYDLANISKFPGQLCLPKLLLWQIPEVLRISRVSEEWRVSLMVPFLGFVQLSPLIAGP